MRRTRNCKTHTRIVDIADSSALQKYQTMHLYTARAGKGTHDEQEGGEGKLKSANDPC